ALHLSHAPSLSRPRARSRPRTLPPPSRNPHGSPLGTVFAHSSKPAENPAAQERSERHENGVFAAYGRLEICGRVVVAANALLRPRLHGGDVEPQAVLP